MQPLFRSGKGRENSVLADHRFPDMNGIVYLDGHAAIIEILYKDALHRNA